MLVVGVLLGIGVGGAGVSLASSPSTVTFCVNKKTAVVRQPKSGRCTKNETRRIMNSSGATGAKGATGASGPPGVAGANGATGATGPAGPSGPAGATGESGTPGTTGATGAVGPTGPIGATGAPGAAGTSGTRWVFGGNGFVGNTGQSASFPLDNDIRSFDITCQKATDWTFTVEYDVQPNERIVTTTSPIGGSGTTATWITTTTGPQTLGSLRIGDHRWQIVVSNDSDRTIFQYDIVLIANDVECQSWFAYTS